MLVTFQMPSARPKRLVMTKRGSTESGWGCQNRMNRSRPTLRAVAARNKKRKHPRENDQDCQRATEV